MSASPHPEVASPTPGPQAQDASAQHQPFAHVVAPNANLYRAVMGVFARAKQRFTVHLRPEDVQAALPAEQRPGDVEAVATVLDRLAEWGNLRPDPDTSRVTAVEDFYRRRYIYQLTRAGEAAEEALATYDEALGRRGVLQAVALADIVAQLRELTEYAQKPEPDPAKVHLALRDLVGRFTDLADNARAFMGSLQRTIDLHDADVRAFLAYKDRLIDYLERFIADLITTGAEIATLLGELEQPVDGVPRVHRLLWLAAERDAADTAPDDGSGDDAAETAAPEDVGGGDLGTAAIHASWCERWRGLRGWFLATDGQQPQVKLLRSSARSAIPQLLTVVSTLNERRSGRSDRSADFRTLARWFAEAPDDAARHRLWRVAFGVHPARHLTVTHETLQGWRERPVAPTTPWARAEPVRISPQLRRTGSYERRGRPNRVADRSEERRYLAEMTRMQNEEIAAARKRLDTGGPILLSEVGELDPAAFGLFLGLLGDALSAWPHGSVESVATSNDGEMEIHMRRLDGGGVAEIHTPQGVFRGPDHTVDIVDLAGGNARR